MGRRAKPHPPHRNTNNHESHRFSKSGDFLNISILRLFAKCVNDIDLHIDISVHKNSYLFGCALLHLLCHMRVSVQREGSAIVAKHAGNCLCVYPALDR